MSETVTLESPDGRRIRTDSPTEINTLTGSYGYHVVDGDASSDSSKTTKQPSSKPTDKTKQYNEPAHEPDANPIDPQTRVDIA